MQKDYLRKLEADRGYTLYCPECKECIRRSAIVTLDSQVVVDDKPCNYCVKQREDDICYAQRVMGRI